MTQGRDVSVVVGDEVDFESIFNMVRSLEPGDDLSIQYVNRTSGTTTNYSIQAARDQTTISPLLEDRGNHQEMVVQFYTKFGVMAFSAMIVQTHGVAQRILVIDHINNAAERQGVEASSISISY